MKYKQHGYQDDEPREKRQRVERERRDPDLPGGRLADPQHVLRHLRCHQCGNLLPLDFDARGGAMAIPLAAKCRDCEASVHACRNCTHFDPDAHLECRKPVKTSYKKTAANDCDLFEPKLVVEMTRDESRRDSGVAPSADAPPRGSSASARKAFEDLFK